jgi:MFS transporter, DHA1 family, multidrug resistance protein
MTDANATVTDLNQKQYLILILILGSLTAIAPFSIDMYLPAFPEIARDLETSAAQVGLSLTTFFAGIAAGQLIYGPLIDRYGRKKPLVIGLIIYVVASLLCALAPSISWLIAARLLSALGGCVGIVVASAVVRDLFPVTETARIFSTLILVTGLAPMIAPTIGGFVASVLGWRYIFLVLTIISLFMLLAVIFYLPESKGPDTTISLKPAAIFSSYIVVLKEPAFLTYAFAGSLATAGMFAYIAGSPFVFIELFGLSEQQYGLAFGINALGLIGASQVGRLLLKKYTSETIVSRAATVLAIIGVLLAGGNILGVWTAAVNFVLIFCFIFCLGFIMPTTNALSLAPFAKNAGSASALMGSLRMFAGVLASAAVSFFHNGTAIPMTVIMVVCAVTSFFLCSYKARARAEFS